MEFEAREAQQLHDRQTRGENLSEEELQQLEAWYAEQDLTEELLLGSAAADTELAQLEGRISATLQRIADMTYRIQSISREISVLRDENYALKHRLARALHASRS